MHHLSWRARTPTTFGFLHLLSCGLLTADPSTGQQQQGDNAHRRGGGGEQSQCISTCANYLAVSRSYLGNKEVGRLLPRLWLLPVCRKLPCPMSDVRGGNSTYQCQQSCPSLAMIYKASLAAPEIYTKASCCRSLSRLMLPPTCPFTPPCTDMPLHPALH